LCAAGPSSVKVPANDKASYAVAFTPTWACDETCKLTLRNSRSGDTFEYTLRGVGDEPLAEGHETIKCNARETIEHRFKVSNTGAKPATYNIESDIPFVSGEPDITVPAGGSKDYVMKLAPQLGGAYTGSVMFTHAVSGEFSWYTVEVSVDSPLEESQIDIAAVVRQAVSVEISLANPLPEAIEFEVLLQGEGLLGDATFTLGPSRVGTYELFYSPLVAKAHTGSIAFLNDRVGEFWYKLKLAATPAQPVTLPLLSCAVGAKCAAPITVENPLGKEISLAAMVTNRTNFVVDPPNVTVPPYGAASVNVEYVPSSLGEDEHTQITLSNPALGDWQYLVTGRGELPGLMPEHTPVATVGEANSYMFSFRNPFPLPLVVDVNLRLGAPPPPGASEKEIEKAAKRAARAAEKSGEPPAFTLLLRKTTGLVLSPFASMSVPLSFLPVSIAEKHATVEVRGSHRDQPLAWTFPVRGVVNAPPHLHAFTFACQAKKSIRQVVELPLRALADLTGPETFTHELIIPDAIEPLVGRALQIDGLETTIRSADQPLKFQVRAARRLFDAPARRAMPRLQWAAVVTVRTCVRSPFQVLFEPLRPFSTSVTLVVKRGTGGRWPFELQLDSLEPDPDDTITIEANLAQTSTVKFALTNRFPSYATFQAYFSTESAYTLSVSPANGLLAPAGSEGTVFAVSFAPTEYGKLQRGRLIITTAELQWTYEVVGTHPHFALPRNVSSKVDSHLRSTYAAQLGQRVTKNAIRKNMSKAALAQNRDRAPSVAQG
jgi:hypothetical protein